MTFSFELCSTDINHFTRLCGDNQLYVQCISVLACDWCVVYMLKNFIEKYAPENCVHIQCVVEVYP